MITRIDTTAPVLWVYYTAGVLRYRPAPFDDSEIEP